MRVVCFEPPKVLDNHHLQLARGIVIETKQPIPPQWAIVSYQVVEVTPWVGPKTRNDQRQLRIHLQLKKALVPSVRLRGKLERWGGTDLGLEKTLTLHDGRHWTLPDRSGMEEELAKLQRAQARCNRRCNRYRMLGRKIRKLHRKAVHRDQQWMWNLASQLAEELDVLVLEDLKLKNLVRSTRGSATMPGRGAAQKRGLNRRLHRAGLGRLKTILARAFAKRGKATKVVNPRGTSTTCHGREPGTSATGQPRVGKEAAGQPAQVWPEGLPRAESNTAKDAADAAY